MRDHKSMQDRILLIDMGNSRTKTAEWSTVHGLKRRVWWNTGHPSTAARNLWNEPWTGAVLSSVISVDSLAELLNVLAKNAVSSTVISPELVNRLGLVSGLYSGQGPDRVANVVGMARLHPLPALCIDMGTAITFDLLDGAKHYVGGLIIPGPSLMAHSLAHGTARLPEVERGAGPLLLASETRAAISKGCWWGGVAVVNGLLDMLSHNSISWRTLVITGGISGEYAPHISYPHVVDRDITFKGMTLVWHAGNARAHAG